MSCLLHTNQCVFTNCGQWFATSYDLIAHVEYTHIPVIQEDLKRKSASSSNSDDKSSHLPLSIMSRVFRTASRPNPIKYEPIKLAFNHYKRRTLRDRLLQHQQQAQQIRMNKDRDYHAMKMSLLAQQQQQSNHIPIEDSEKRLGDIDFEECAPNDPNQMYKCQMVDCSKRYKNVTALKLHMRANHSVVIGEDVKNLNHVAEDIKPNVHAMNQQMGPQHQGMQYQQHQQMQMQTQSHPHNLVPKLEPRDSTPVTSNNAIGQMNGGHPSASGASTPNSQVELRMPNNVKDKKCDQCSKAYKTNTGLSNHMLSAHQKTTPVDSPSQQVLDQLINQARQQRVQQEQAQGYFQMPTVGPRSPQSMMPPNNARNSFQSVSSTRAYSVTTSSQPLRFSQQHYSVNLDNQQSTGQVLQLQMQQQKRMKQQQLQQQQQQNSNIQQQQQQNAQNMQQQKQQIHQQGPLQMNQGQMGQHQQQQMGQPPPQAMGPPQQPQQMNMQQQQHPMGPPHQQQMGQVQQQQQPMGPPQQHQSMGPMQQMQPMGQQQSMGPPQQQQMPMGPPQQQPMGPPQQPQQMGPPQHPQMQQGQMQQGQMQQSQYSQMQQMGPYQQMQYHQQGHHQMAPPPQYHQQQSPHHPQSMAPINVNGQPAPYNMSPARPMHPGNYQGGIHMSPQQRPMDHQGYPMMPPQPGMMPTSNIPNNQQMQQAQHPPPYNI